MRFIDEHRDRYAVALLLRVLDVTASTYYGWVQQDTELCDRDLVDLGLLTNIYDIWEASGRTYRAERVHRQLRRDGIRVGCKRVERLMAGQGWQGAFLPKRSALEYGIWSRDVRDGQLIHHSDRGSTYTAFRFTHRLADNGIRPSMGSVGDSYDNALMENFWSTLKIELVYRNAWRTRDEAENAIFTYIDGWHNTRCIQKELGYLSPDEYETAWRAQHTEPLEAAIVTPTPTGAR